MPLFALDKKLWFPPVHLSEPDGLLAMGGDLSVERLLLAYRNGIFPWYDEESPILWWSPDPRLVLFPSELKISKSMRAVLNREDKPGGFQFTTNKAFPAVIEACRSAVRPRQDSTWISDEVVKAYCRMHTNGHAHSAEAWREGKLVGGLYGIRMGSVFFGESMFATDSNASKFAFAKYVRLLETEGVQLIDCQVETDHLISMGAHSITREKFVQLLHQYIPA